MVLQDAYAAAQRFLDEALRPNHDLEIVICSVAQFPNAWVFGYSTRRFLTEGDLFESLVGMGPVVVPMSGAEPFLGGPDHPIEHQIKDI